jgi:hypothetical protein
LRRREDKELKRFEEKLLELLNKREISFPADEDVARFYEKQMDPEEVKGVVERCLKTLRERGVIRD